ncbi:MAG: CHAD domain-containing protein [Bryobacteraceae bacterium]
MNLPGRTANAMAYHLKSDESVPEGIKRVASEEMESAAAQLTGKGEPDRDEAIHEARKSIKKTRAVLKLMRDELGETYNAENARLRDAGRDLSRFRDAGAIIGTFDSLVEKYRLDLKDQSLESIRHGLQAKKQESEQQGQIDRVLKRRAATLRQVGKRVKAWRLDTDGFPALAPGLENTYRRGKQAMAQAQKHPRPENYHEWRKRVKDLWYHVRLLEYVWTDVMQAYEKALKELETWLGDDHNLIVLRDQVMAEPEFYGKEQDVARLLQLMDKYHKELRDNACSVGERIYEEKPRQFSRRMQHTWDSWQAQPKTLEAAS